MLLIRTFLAKTECWLDLRAVEEDEEDEVEDEVEAEVEVEERRA